MATIRDLEADLEKKRTAEGFLRADYQRLRMEAGGLRAGTGTDAGKLFRTAKDTSPEKAREINGAKAAMMRAAKARKAAEARLDDATLRAARPNGSTREGKASVYTMDGQGARQFLLDLQAASTGRRNSDAVRRLERNQRIYTGGRELREVDSTDARGFLGPAWMGDFFATQVRVAPAIRSAFVEMPWENGRGWLSHIPRVEVGATAGIVDSPDTSDLSDNSGSVQSATADSKLGVVSGKMVVDLPVYERSDPAGAIVWLRELYAATDSVMEDQFLNGQSSVGEGHLDGLRSVTGIQTYSYTSVSPTPVEFLQNLARAKARFAENRFAPASHVIVHPRRAEWAMSATGADFPLIGGLGGYATAPAADAAAGALLGMRIIVSTVVPAALGGSNDEDAVVLVKGDDVYWSQSRRFLHYRQSIDENGKIQANVEAVSYIRLWANRYPLSILEVTGTGLTGPAGW